MWNRREWLCAASTVAGVAGLGKLAPPSVALGADAPAAEPLARVANCYIRTVWNDGRHNGFPGIAKFGDYYYVTFRSANSHKEKSDARIIVVRSKVDDLTKWEQVGSFNNGELDARDPLLFVVGDRLRLVWHAKEDWTSDTADGTNWTEQKLLDTEIVEPTPESKLVLSSRRRWLFRIRKGPDGAYYSLARCGIKDDNFKAGRFGLILYRSTDGFTFKALHTYGEGATRAMGGDAGGIGWGHEADVAWRADGMMFCAIRNSGPGVIVYAPPPYTDWKALPRTDWETFGGPALHTPASGGMLVAAREVAKERPAGTYPSRLVVRSVTTQGVSDPFTIPCSGDGAYSSFERGRTASEELLVYYSSHEWPQKGGVGDNPAGIYLAHLTVRPATK